jgi:hypothetical protein
MLVVGLRCFALFPVFGSFNSIGDIINITTVTVTVIWEHSKRTYARVYRLHAWRGS